MTRVRPNDSVVVAWLDRFSRNFDEGVKIQAELTRQNIGIVAIRERIDTADDSAAAKLFRRMMLAQGAYQVESTSERIKAGLERAKAEGRGQRALATASSHARAGAGMPAHVRRDPLDSASGPRHEGLPEYREESTGA